jgi:hypothetical protein
MAIGDVLIGTSVLHRSRHFQRSLLSAFADPHHPQSHAAMSKHPEVLWAQRSSSSTPEKVRPPPPHSPITHLILSCLVERHLLDC